MSERKYEDVNGLGLSFRLDPNFVEKEYPFKEVRWGYGVLSELIFLRSYSREKDARTGTSWPYNHKDLEDIVPGGKEQWWEVCERVINGMYSIQKDHVKSLRLNWNEEQAQESAKIAYDKMFNFKWTPAGRGLWAMGTYLVNGKHDSSSLYNCFFVSTKDLHEDFAEPFCFLMDASMMGGGVGFDTQGAVGLTQVVAPKGAIPYRIPDSREGWVKSLELLLKAYVGGPMPHFDYSQIRPEGSPIVTFGGVAPGPEPLRTMHERIKNLLEAKLMYSADQSIDSKDIVDIMNIIGVAVVSGNVRRSSEIAFGSYYDGEFWQLKDYTRKNSYRAEWGWMSNNSLRIEGDTRPDFDAIARKINTGWETHDKGAGEPGLYFIDNARNYGRMNNGPDFSDQDVMGANPCGEIPLESHEACNLSEVYSMRHSNVVDFTDTLKYAYLYNKSVTLLPTHWEKTNQVQLRNRRIGVSMTGTAHFVDTRGYDVLREWMDEGYQTIRHWDKVYSRWLCVRESIKVTTSKPSGTVSLVAGTTAGVHWPVGEHYIRRITLPKDSPLVSLIREAGYVVQESYYSPNTSVVAELPVKVPGVRSEEEVSVYEKIGLVAFVQKWWADNMVSNTIVFNPKTEEKDLANALKMHASGLKSVAAMPSQVKSFKQLPEEWIHENVYDERMSRVVDVDFSRIYNGDVEAGDAQRQLGCDSDACEVQIGSAG